MRCFFLVLLAFVTLGLAGTSARANKIVLPDIHGESDVADEAAAVTMLVRSSLMRDARTLVQPEQLPERVTVAIAPAILAKIDADTAVLGEFVREGTGLRVTVILVDRDGTSNVSLVRAGDGDVRGLANAILDRIKDTTHVTPGPLPAFGLGRLRPYISAQRASKTDPAAAAIALVDAIPTTANAVPGATWGLHGIIGKVDDPRAKLVAARALAALQEVDAVAANAKPPMSAVAASIANLERAKIKEADDALAAIAAKDAKDGLVLFTRVLLADAHGNAASAAGFAKDALATDAVTQRAILAWASKPDAPKLPPELQKAVLAYVEKFETPGVASRIGLAAARTGIEVPRALALVSVRDLDDGDLAALDGLVTTGTDATALRLRAELAMRRADGSEAVAIEAYAKGSPNEARAHLYKGYQLMSEGKHDLAAAQFGDANATREKAHALMLADDLQQAIATIARSPISPEEYVVSARIAISEHRIADAERDIAIAEEKAPASPFVQRVIADVAAQPGATIPADRVPFARTIADTGTAPAITSSSGTVKTGGTGIADGSAAIGSGSAIAATGSGSGSATAKKRPSKIDDRLAALDLGPLLQSLKPVSNLLHRRIAIAELAWVPDGFTWRTTEPANLRPVLELALSTPPYRLDVSQKAPMDVRPLSTTRLDELLGDNDALLLYQVQAAGGDAKVVLEIYPRGAKATTEVSDTFPGAGLVKWDFGKLVPILIAVIILFGIIGFFIVRGSGTIVVKIEKAPDASDEVFCVVVSKSPTRPQVNDPLAFRNAMKKAGSVVKRRSATLISSGAEFRVPPGTWFVHLYGTYERGGVTLPLPPSAFAEVTVKRGTDTPAKIDLVPTTAELVVTIEGESNEKVAISIGDGKAFYPDASGQCVIPVSRGSHVITFTVKEHEFKRDVATPQARIYRYAFNMAREMRIIEAGLDGSSAVSKLKDAPKPADDEIAVSNDDGLDDGEIILANPPPNIGAGETMSAPGQAAKVSLPQELMSDALAAINAANQAVAMKADDAGVKFGKTMAIAAKTTVDDDRLLDRYRKTSELGRGAMGVVHRAWDENLEREVAIKVMADDLQKNVEAMKLFAQEAKALAQLNHTNIVAVYDQVTVAERTYMIMEYVDGTTLEKLAEGRGPFPVKDAIEIADQLCAGLAYAHARRVIHRDIKPANIFVARDSTIKLGDFGLARVVRELTIRKTEIRGTPLYMAPEQITGNDLDHRVDLYAVGCTMYELLCGKPPFMEGDILYHQLNTKPIPPSKKRAGIPAALDAIVMQLLEKKADDRPSSANDVRTALKKI